MLADECKTRAIISLEMHRKLRTADACIASPPARFAFVARRAFAQTQNRGERPASESKQRRSNASRPTFGSASVMA